MPRTASVIPFKTRNRSNFSINLDDSEKLCKLIQDEIDFAFRSGITMVSIAEEAGLSSSTVWHIWSGYTKQPRTQTAIKLLQVFGLKLTVHGS